jgi:single-stranded DNA-binding protein
MIDPKNVVSLTCGVVADPEIVAEKIVKFRVAADYSASDKNSDNNSGYFDVVYYLGDNSNSKFLSNQLSQGKMKKGSQVQILGRLVQERYKAQDDSPRSRVVIVAEAVTYAGSAKPQSSSAASTTTSSTTSQASYSNVPSEF